MNSTVERLLGRLLAPVRAGDRHLAWHAAGLEAAQDLHLTSPAFRDGGEMPMRHAGQGVGDNISPALRWTPPPAAAVELVLMMQDPDVPLPRPVLHLLATGIAPQLAELPERALGGGAGEPRAAILRLRPGAFGRVGYAGPRPVRGHGRHRYVFQLYAVDRVLVLPETAGLADVVAAMAGHVVARGTLTGTYERA